MYGAPRKNPPLTQEQIDHLALAYIIRNAISIKDRRACGLDRKLNHDERDMIYRRVESLGTELVSRIPARSGEYHEEYR